jgi:hypothetical protein
MWWLLHKNTLAACHMKDHVLLSLMAPKITGFTAEMLFTFYVIIVCKDKMAKIQNDAAPQH